MRECEERESARKACYELAPSLDDRYHLIGSNRATTRIKTNNRPQTWIMFGLDCDTCNAFSLPHIRSHQYDVQFQSLDK